MKLRKMNILLLLAVITMLTGGLSAQTRLKHFEVIAKDTPLTSLQVDHPDCAVLVVHSAIPSITFESNMGKIKAQEYRALESRYVIFLYPEKQKVAIKCPGYVETEFPMFSELKPRQQFTYEVNEALGTQGKGSLRVSSEPTGADILIDGIPTNGFKTPHTFSDLLAMQYRITLKVYRYQDSTFTAIVNTTTETNLNICLKPAYGNLSISSTPNNARIFINDKLRGSSPLNLSGKENGLDEGTYRIRINADRYKDVERSITVKEGGTYTESFSLEPLFGSLTVTSEPSGAKVYLDAKELGTTNLVLSGAKDGLESGTYKLRIVPPTANYKEEIRTITISHGKQANIDISFESITANLKVESALQPFQVYLNGVLNAELSTGKQSTIAAKELNLKVVYTGDKNKAYNPYEESLSLNIGESRTIVAQFISKFVPVSFSGDLPYVNLTITNSDNGDKEYEGLIGSPVQLLPGDYYCIASKQGYLDHYQKIKVTAFTTVQILLLPKNITTILKNEEGIKKPNSLQTTITPNLQYRLKWDKVNNIGGYIIDRRNSRGEWKNGLISVSPELTELTDKNPGTNPVYRIYCYSNNSISLPTESASKVAVKPAQVKPSVSNHFAKKTGMIFVGGGTFRYKWDVIGFSAGSITVDDPWLEYETFEAVYGVNGSITGGLYEKNGASVGIGVKALYCTTVLIYTNSVLYNAYPVYLSLFDENTAINIGTNCYSYLKIGEDDFDLGYESPKKYLRRIARWEGFNFEISYGDNGLSGSLLVDYSPNLNMFSLMFNIAISVH